MCPLLAHAFPCSPREAEIPPTYKITGEWDIAENWGLSAFVTSPKNIRPKSTIECKDFFLHLDRFKDTCEPVPVVEKQNRPKEDDETTDVTTATPRKGAEDDIAPDDSVSCVAENLLAASSISPSKAGALSSKDLAAAIMKLRRKAGGTST